MSCLSFVCDKCVRKASIWAQTGPNTQPVNDAHRNAWMNSHTMCAVRAESVAKLAVFTAHVHDNGNKLSKAVVLSELHDK